jgi:hypothetical protein
VGVTEATVRRDLNNATFVAPEAELTEEEQSKAATNVALSEPEEEEPSPIFIFGKGAKRTSAEIEIQEQSYEPSKSPSVRQHVLPAPSGTRPGKRQIKAPVNPSQIDKLELRGPQVLKVTLSGHQPAKIFP